MGQIEVTQRGGVIHAIYRGEMTMALVQDAAAQIRAMLPAEGGARLLYDTTEMEEPERELTRWMAGFDEEIRPRVARAATVAPHYLVRAQAQAAFLHDEDHAYFQDLDSALEWLNKP